MAERIYLDHISATAPAVQAIHAAMPFYDTCFAQPSAPHQMGQELFSHLEVSENQIRAFFGATADDQFVFTASGAEAIAQVVNSAYQMQFKKVGKNHFVARSIDDASIVLALSRLEDEGCFLRLAPCTARGFVSKEALIDSISARTAMVSVSLVSALTGVIQPLEEIAEVCKQRAIWLHVDVTHALGKLPVSFADLPCDFITFDGQGLHAPLGTGGLFARKEIPLHPQILGAPFNVPAFMALGMAAMLSQDWQSLYCTEVCRLRGSLEVGIKELVSDARVLFEDEERLPNVTCIAFPQVASELLAFALNRKGVFACMGGGQFQLIERLLLACQVESQFARSALVFSLSKDTQEHEIERACAIIGDALKRLSKISKAII